MKELFCMELGGNKNALEYYTQHDMMQEGKPNHEAAPHVAYKHQLAQKAEAAMKEANIQVGGAQK